MIFSECVDCGMLKMQLEMWGIILEQEVSALIWKTNNHEYGSINMDSRPTVRRKLEVYWINQIVFLIRLAENIYNLLL